MPSTTRPATFTRRTLFVILTTAGVSLAAACMTETSTTTPRPTDPAACLTAPALNESTATVAVVADVGSRVGTYAADLATVLRGAEGAGARVVISGIGADRDASSLMVNTVLVGEGNNRLERDRNLACKRDAITARLDEHLLTQQDPRQRNVFAAIDTLAGALADAPTGARIDVVLLSSLLNTSGPADLSRPEIVGNPGETLNTLAAQRLLPDCTGWRVYAVGAGHGIDPALDDAAAAQLREFWRQYFQRCGGELVAWTPHLDSFPTDAAAIAPADTTQIPVEREPDRTIATLSGDVLFDPGSDHLRPQAAGQLDQLRVLVEQTPGTVEIAGYTDVGGDEADNQALSNRRSRAVADWLTARGTAASRLTTIGHGSADSVHPDPGNDDERQANRRVVVTIHTRH